MKTPHIRSKGLAALIGFAALAAAQPSAANDANDETYQFIVTDASVNESYSAESAAIALEARYRTWDESEGIAMRSDARAKFTIIIR